MSIQKKSLISTLKTTKKANVASTPASEGGVKGEKQSSMRRFQGVVHGSTKQAYKSLYLKKK